MKIRFYRTREGKEPARDYLHSLDSKQEQKVAQILSMIQAFDGRVPAQYLRKLAGTNIWEVRVIFAGNILLLSFFDGLPRVAPQQAERGGDLIIVAHGFTKKTQKTPRREIDIAERRRRDYFT